MFFDRIFGKTAGQRRQDEGCGYRGSLYGSMGGSFAVEDVFFISGRGTVASGRVLSGSVRRGDSVMDRSGRRYTVGSVEAFRKELDAVHMGESAGLLLRDASRGDLRKGDVLTVAT